MEAMWKIAVIGTGGVGGYFGGRLAQLQDECQVHFVVRGETLQVLKRDGLRVDSLVGDFHIPPDRCNATDDLASVGPVDLVITAVKLPLQNGVEAADILARAVDKKHVVGGFCKIISYIVKHGHIRHDAADPTVAFGEVWASETAPGTLNSISDRITKLKDLFEKAQGVKVELFDDIRVGLWHKFMLICAVSGLGAITRAPLGVFLGVEETRDLFRQVLFEVAKLAQAQGIELTDEAAEKLYTYFLGRAESERNATSSMQRDIMRGLPSELEWQVGAVVRKAKALGVPAPACSLIYAALLPQELKARGKLAFSIE
ncbi:2dehydropantoate 2-reductase [Acanthamoeba castellanii str. Neff]|uniref:2dehydropantoate 2-reductase n=1 Tax=Acanthamoeba castellanii (strain ATCC 30010 / Neff) TaxID=1257118 RepID=L8GHX0_ACACF|nr:2dehydropantoate 2-reductase [Acanthamoeba castellanii str. Neff]ELR12358.1 2dehydropantoate 2-reductase [Acanthamoeba castellanii str. Neff]